VTGEDWLKVWIFLVGLMGGLPLIRWFAARVGASPEVARKLVHVATGLTCVGFPWWFDGPGPVWVLAGLATLPLMVVRWFPALREGVGSALHGVKRPSYGEVLFAPAVAAVFHLSGGDPARFCIPVGILTLADAAGAVGGTRWGRHRYGSGDGFKSAEGSAVFLVTAVGCVVLPLWLMGGVALGSALLIGWIVGLLAMMAEGLADRGFDNLVIPLGCYLVLDRLLGLDDGALAWRLVTAVLFLVLVVTGSRWSTLSGGALLGCALLGYGCAVLADFRFILPPLGVFLCHVWVTRGNRLVGVFDHRLDAVLSVAIGCLPWVIGVERGWIDETVGLAGISYAMACQLGLLDTATSWWLRGRPAGLLRSMGKGWVCGAMPGLVGLWPGSIELMLWTGVAVVSTGVGVFGFQGVMGDGVCGQDARATPTRVWVLKGFVGLISSLPALGLMA
jgi:phytol kinase